MKSFFKTLFICTFVIGLFAACTKEADNSELKEKVDAISAELNTLKAQQQAMQTVIEAWKKGGYIQSIDNSVPGQHTITFYGENGKTVVIYDGIDGQDGKDGLDGKDGKDGVDGKDGDSFFKSIVTTEEGVTFTLMDETSFTIPFVKAFKLVIENPSAEVEAGQTVNFPYEVKNANATTTVDVFAGGNYQAVVNDADKKIVVTAPDPATPGSVLAWAQNEEGLFSMRKLNFIVKADVEINTQVEDYQGIAMEGGDVVVKLVSNVDIVVPEPEEDWVTVSLTKANYTLTLTLAENTTGEPREAILKVLRADTGAQVQEIKIIQLGKEKELGPLDSNVKWEIVESAYDKLNPPSTGQNVLNVTYGGVEYKNVDHVKMGTAKKAGKISLTLPAGTVYVSFWAVGWKAYDGLLKINELGQTITIPQNDGVSGTEFNVTVSDEDKFEITLPQALPEDTVVNLETVLDGTAPAGLRVTLFGIMAYDEVPEKPEPKMTIADIQALCTSGTAVDFEGDFEGVYVNYVLGNQHIYLEDETGAIRFYLGSGNTLAVGTKLSGKLTGKCLLDGNGRPQISSLDWWTAGTREDDKQAEMPQPVTGTLASFAEANYNTLLFRRVALVDVVLEQEVSSSGTYTISDDSGTFKLMVNFNPGQTLPQGTKVSCVGTFDKSGDNKFIKVFAITDVTGITPPEQPAPKMTIADIQALCTSSTPVDFEGEFDGIYVNYILSNQHIYLEDESGAIRFYLDSGNTLEVGSKLSGKLTGKCVKDGNGRPQISVLDWWTAGKREDDKKDEMPNPVTGTLASFAAADYNTLLFRRVALTDVVLEEEVSAKGTYTISDDSGTFKLTVNFNPGQTLPKGTKVSCVGTFDKSGENKFIKVFAITDVTGITPPENPQPEPKMTIADIQALCTSTTPVDFEGEFEGIYVNYILSNQHIYLEDESGAIRFYLASGNDLKVGSKLSGKLTGKCLLDGNGRPQISVLDWWTAGLREDDKQAEMPQPVTGTLASFAAADYNTLLFRRVALTDVVLEQEVSSSGTYTISDDSGTFKVTVNFNPGQTLPKGTKVSCTGTFDKNGNNKFIKVFSINDVTGITPPENPQPETKMTVADIKALCTSTSPVNFEGSFDGIYVNYILGNQHIYLEDATGAIRFYLGSGNTLKVGSKLSGTLSGTCLLDSSGRPQIATLDWWTAGKREDDMQAEMPQPMTGTLAEFTAMDIKDIMFRRVYLENVVLGSAVTAKGQTITITDNTGSYKLKINCEISSGNQVPQGYKVSGYGTFDVDGGNPVIKLHSLADVTDVIPSN